MVVLPLRIASTRASTADGDGDGDADADAASSVWPPPPWTSLVDQLAFGDPRSPSSSSSSSGSSSNHPECVEDDADADARRVPPLVVAAPPASGSGDARDSKLRRHRESMARFRRDRQARIAQMAEEERQLHRRLRRVLRSIARRRERERNASSEPKEEGTRLAYADLVRAYESLLQEQYATEEEIARHTKLVRVLLAECERMHDDTRCLYQNPPPTADQRLRGEALMAGATRQDQGAAPGYWLRYDDHDPPFFYEFESAECCASHVRRGLQTLQRMRLALPPPTTPASAVTHCLGWRAERSVTRNGRGDLVLQFRFSRRVPRIRASLEELHAKSWEVIKSPELVSRIYSGKVMAKVVQVVNQDTIVMLRNSPEKDHHLRFRYFSLNTKLWAVDDATGARSAVLLMMMLDKQPRQQELEERHGVASSFSSSGPSTMTDDEAQPQHEHPEPVVWMNDGGAYLRFTEVGPGADAIEIEYVGFVACLNADHAAHLMVESCAVLLRWEHFVVPPRLLAL